MKKLLGTEDIGGRVVKDWLHLDDNGNEVITTEVVQDVEPILNRNIAKYNDAPVRFGNRTFHEVAEIPYTVLEETCRLKQIPFAEMMQCKTDRAQAAWRELLNAREFRYFRTRPGRVDVKQHGS